MSYILQDALSTIKSAKGFRAVFEVVIDANASGDQFLFTVGSTSLYPARILYITESGTPTLGVIKMGYNVARNDVVANQVLTTIPVSPNGLAGNPNSGFNVGSPGQNLYAVMSTLAGVAAQVRVIMEAYGG